MHVVCMTTTKPQEAHMAQARITKKVRNDAQFQALVAVIGDDQKALVAFQRLNPEPEPEPEIDPRIQALVDKGFTVEQAELALSDVEATVEAVVEAPVTEKDKADALVTERGFGYAKGRVYATPLLAEAVVRVHRGGKAEIVPSSGVGRTKAVLVYREDSGDVALQNLTKSEEA
jgi:hypothetical protein